MRRWAVVFLGLVGIGCSQYQAGDEFEIPGTTCFFTDEKLFRDAIDREKAGASAGLDGLLSQLDSGGMELIGENDGATLKIVEPVSGGAKVAIAGGKHSGKLGWVSTSALKHRVKK